MADDLFSLSRQLDELTGTAARREMDELTGAATRRDIDELTGAAARREIDELTGAAARREFERMTGAATRREIDELTGAAARLAMAELLGGRRTRLFERIVEKQPDLRVALLEEDFYERFIAAIASAQELNGVTGLSPSTDLALRHMLFANVITCLETYLGDAIISTIKSNRGFMRRFFESFRDFEGRKFSLNEVFTVYDAVDEMAIQAMASVIYHDLAKVKGIYKDAVGVVFPGEIDHLYRAVHVRHDIVHRNGRDKEGCIHDISSEAVDQLATQVSEFVEEVHRQIVQIRSEEGNSDLIEHERPAQANEVPDGMSRSVALP